MYNYIEVDEGFVGFGIDKDDAKWEAYVKKCGSNIAKDASGVFTKRLEELSPWLPKPNLLHVTGLGCLEYKDYCITELNSGKTVLIGPSGLNMYYYIANTFGNKVTYEDIRVVLRSKLNEFFNNINSAFTPIEKMPDIKVLGVSNGFKPKVQYTFKCGYVIGISDKMVGIRKLEDELFYAIEREIDTPVVSILSYIGYRMGLVISKEGIEICGLKHGKML